jgi:uncharacterized protein with ATP-grasp and redox domains
LTYNTLRSIFRLARCSYKPTEFTAEVGDREENPFKEAKRRVAEAERRVAEAERRAADAERRAAAELEQRVAGVRHEAE